MFYMDVELDHSEGKIEIGGVWEKRFDSTWT
jgi:hypothetical protein